MRLSTLTVQQGAFPYDPLLEIKMQSNTNAMKHPSGEPRIATSAGRMLRRIGRHLSSFIPSGPAGTAQIMLVTPAMSASHSMVII
jgi:hypothetical protein